MTSKRNQMQEDTRFRVLRLLHDKPEMSQRELARAVGICAGSAHYILKTFVKKGFVKLGNFSTSPDKRRYAYILTPKGMAEKAAITRHFLARKITGYKALRDEIAELKHDAGETDFQSSLGGQSDHAP